MSNDALVVIGAGHAGSECAVQAREAGWSGPIQLIGEESPLPYHRPPLSKSYLSGAVEASSISLRASAAYEKAGVDLMLGRRVLAIDREQSTVKLADGFSLPFARLVLATGGKPRTVEWDHVGSERASNVHYVRTLADIDGLRKGFVAGAKLVLVGGGYIGLEVAAVAVKAGLQVTVLESADRVLARVTAPVLSSFYQSVHRDAGVDVRTSVQVSVAEWSADGTQVEAVRSAKGERFACDLVVLGIGLVPDTQLASQAGLKVDDGIVVDDKLCTSDPRILSIGDCARFHSTLYDRSIRLESVGNALDQARSAAAVLGGKPALPVNAPWFWSDQYDLKLKMVGLSLGYDRIAVRGSIESRSFSVFYLQGGSRVLAVDTLNRPADFMAAKRLVGERANVNAEQLCDEEVSLKDL